MGDSLAPWGAISTVEERTGNVSALIEHVEGAAADVEAIVGVSLGAHALARWAAGRENTPPLVLLLPAWTGEPDEVAAATLMTADSIAARGPHEILARLPHGDSAQGRISDLVRLGWSSYTPEELATALRTASSQPGPTALELMGIHAPCAIVGWADDALHPVAVAREWAAHIRGSRLVEVEQCDPVYLRAVLPAVVDSLSQAAPSAGA